MSTLYTYIILLFRILGNSHMFLCLAVIKQRSKYVPLESSVMECPCLTPSACCPGGRVDFCMHALGRKLLHECWHVHVQSESSRHACRQQYIQLLCSCVEGLRRSGFLQKPCRVCSAAALEFSFRSRKQDCMHVSSSVFAEMISGRTHGHATRVLAAGDPPSLRWPQGR